ncbi:hypothetical protein SAMN04487783_0069 [Agrococcus baldri]|uniref:TPR-repeat-containing protein n=2 Tax=Agrococcus baldri TaxID=153730 RepID=A0AA94KYB3_9MICO|nr:hypothetical protein SAMN04487783_0069 [Agrococcus baldri]
MRDDDFVAPDLPEDIQAEDLDIGARAQLKTLTKENAEYVAKHMAMAGQLIDDNPELAHQHALTAARRAGRIGVVRETLAITAYQLGDFALALRELRTYRRITGRDDQLPLMADCERGLGRPEKALELARSVDASTLDTAVRVELAIVKSGARLDLGQQDAALEELRIPELRKDKAFEYSPALFASFAGVLEELGRDDEAAEWFALADRAIDALEAAMAPGELEYVGITTEVGEPIEPVVGDEGVALDPVDGAEPAEPTSNDEALETARDAAASTAVEAADVPENEDETADSDDSADAEPIIETADVPDVDEAPAAAEAEPVVDVEDVPDGDAAEASAADAPASAAGDVPVDAAADAPVDAAADAPVDVPVAAPAAQQDDVLFGDALFGDDLIEPVGTAEAGTEEIDQDRAGEAQRDGDER